MSVEGIKSLVKQERESEEELQRAKQDAARIIEEAKVEARRIQEEVENSRLYDSILDAETKRISEKKRAVETEFDVQVEALERLAKTNMLETVAFIVKTVLANSDT
jgi:V/A-type H+-transporting ATPase subunit G/H